jgi:hypothetical protein
VKAEATATLCTQNDGRPARLHTITESGPYQGRYVFHGIPFQAADGSWGRRTWGQHGK